MNLILYFLGLICLSFSQNYQEEITAKLNLKFPDAHITSKTFTIEPTLKKLAEQAVRQRFFKPTLYTWKIETDQQTYFAILDNVPSKIQMITFLMIFDSQKQITQVEIIKYREAYGGEISQESFLKQFEQKDPKSSFKIGSEIKNISGATISVNSLNSGVKKLTFLFTEIMEQF